MDGERKRSASIHLLEVSGTTVESIELLNAVRSYLKRSFISVNSIKSWLSLVQDVYSLYYFPRVFLEQKYEELMLTWLQDLSQLLSILAVQLARKAHIGDGVYHQFFIRLTIKWVFPIFYLYLRIPKLRTTLFSWVSTLPSENIIGSTVVFGSSLWNNRLWSSMRT